MRKQIFQAIAQRIAERVGDVKFIDLWNNNVAALAGGSVWPTPALFVEFEDIEWRQQGNAARMGDVAVRLHIITRAISTNGHTDPRQAQALAYLDLLDRVNAAMQGLRGEHFAAFQLTTSATNHEHAELIESVERYVTRAQDVSAFSPPSPASVGTEMSIHRR